MRLHLMKYSRPDMSNAVLNLSKILNRGSKAAFQEMHQATQYFLDSKILDKRLNRTEIK